MVAMGDGWGQRSALGDGRGGCLPAIQLLHGCDLAGEHAALYALCKAHPAPGHECDEGQGLHWSGEGDPGDEAAEAGGCDADPASGGAVYSKRAAGWADQDDAFGAGGNGAVHHHAVGAELCLL